MGNARNLGNLIKGSNLNLGQLGRRNYIINGGFDVWQRGTSWAVGSGGYKADRFIDQDHAAFERSTDAPPGFKYSAYIHSHDGGGHQLNQHIENTGQFYVGQQLTISIWAKANRNGLGIKIGSLYSAGDLAGVSTGGNQLVSLTTEWARYSVTVTINSSWSGTSGTLSTYPYGNLGDPELGWTTGDWIKITGFQVEEGNITPFEHKSFSEELAMCQRYYQKLGGPAYTGIAHGINFAPAQLVRGANIYYKCEMRAAPSVVLVGTLIATDRTVYDTDISAISAWSAGTTSASAQFTKTSNSGSDYSTVQIAVKNGTTSYLTLDAEL